MQTRHTIWTGLLLLSGLLTAGAGIPLLDVTLPARLMEAIGLEGFPNHLLTRLTWAAQWGLLAAGVSLIVSLSLWRFLWSTILEVQAPSDKSSAVIPGMLFLCCFVSYMLIERLSFLDYPLTPDEYAYLYQARIVALGHLTVPCHPLQEFFKCALIAEHNGRLFSIMPLGWSLLLAPTILLGIPWVLSPLCTSLGVVCTYAVGRSIYSDRTGLIAAILMALSPFVISNCGTYLTHQASLCLFMCFLVLFIRLEQGGGKTYQYALLGLIMAAVPIIHQLELALLVPCVLVLAYRFIKGTVHPRGKLVVSASIFLVCFVSFTAWHHFCMTGSPLKVPFQVYVDDDNFLSINFVRSPPIGINSLSVLKERLAWTLKRILLLNVCLFPLAPLCMFIAPFLDRRRRWNLLLLSSMICLWVAYMFYNSWGGVQFGPRYYLPTVGIVYVLIAESFLGLARRYGSTMRRGLTLFLVLVFSYSVGLSTAFTRFLPEAVRYTKIIQDVGTYLGKRNIHNSIIFLCPSELDAKVDIYSIYLRVRNSVHFDDDNLVAVDRGTDNRRLMEYYQGRSYFRYKINMDQLVRGEPMETDELQKEDFLRGLDVH